MRLILSLAALLVSTAALAASPELGGGYGAIDAARDVDPVVLAERFCEIRVRRGNMQALYPYFAPKLTKLLDAHAASAVPWQGYMDAPTACRVEVLNAAVDTIGVLVKLHYTAPGRTWADTLNFERTRNSWRLNNVFYETGGNLRFRLFEEPGA